MNNLTNHPATVCSTPKALLLPLLQRIYPQLEAASYQTLADSFRLKEYARGTTLLQQGDVWQTVYLIETGLLRLYFIRSDGREFNKNFYSEGQLICPLTPIMQQQASVFGISCLENSKLWQCPAALFIQTLQQQQVWQPLQNAYLSQLVDNKLQREHELLSLTAKQRYEHFCQRSPVLADRIPLLHLASYLGITDVSLSRLRHPKRKALTK